MIQRILRVMSKEIRGLHETAYLLALFAVFSSVLALFRDRILAGHFGAGEILDVYYTAFRIPDILFFTIALMVSVFVLVPRLTKHTSQKESHAMIGSVLSAFALTMMVVSMVLIPFIHAILEWRFPSLVHGQYGSELISISQIMLLQPVLLGFSNILASITQTHGRYILYATAPLLYNLGIIAGVVLLYPLWGLHGLVYGVLLGALAHMLLQVPFAWKVGFLRWTSFRIQIQETLSIIAVSLPRTVGMSANHIAFLFLSSIAGSIGAGAISVLQLATNLQAAPLNVVGSSYSVAAFPTLARLFSEGKREEFVRNIASALRHIIFWSLPIIALFIVLRAQIVRTVLGTGSFDWADTRLTAAALALFVLSLVLQGVSLLLVRAYYAAEKTILPFCINVFSALVMVGGGYVLTRAMQENDVWRAFFEIILRVEDMSGTSVLMLPLAFTLASLVNVLLLTFFFTRHFGPIFPYLSRVFFDAFAASVVLGTVAHFALELLVFLPVQTTIGIFLQGALAGVLGIIAGSAVLVLLGNQEIQDVWNTVHKKFWRSDAVKDVDVTQ